MSLNSSEWHSATRVELNVIVSGMDKPKSNSDAISVSIFHQTTEPVNWTARATSTELDAGIWMITKLRAVYH